MFDSRQEQYRSPSGAVEEGTSVFFRICLPRALQCTGAVLTVRADDAPHEQTQAMFWAGMEGEDHEWWDCHDTPAASGLYWYRFTLDTRQGRRFLNRRPDGCAAVETAPGECWQLTCYDKGLATPDWLAGGVMYQIFPDRFAQSQAPQTKPNIPTDRILREDWGGQPVWRPDEQGKVRNNDYFGGDLKGIEERLDHLAALGVTCLYINPIFEAHSNHRYDTADYAKIDPLLGTLADFQSLCRAAAQLGMRVLLDGVFSHTGADSVYFNREGRYPPVGAYNDSQSPYSSWYHFQQWPGQYTGWWGFETLPEVNELDPGFFSYICGEGGIARRWLTAGASGWRLDVADELPDEFLDGLRRAVKAEKPDALLLGEVWEDASNKISYGHRRRYLLGAQLDSVMNYPFRDAILAFLRGGEAAAFYNRVGDIVENYPLQVLRLLMNPLGTHDTERALTVLAGEPANGRGRDWQAEQALTPEQRARGLRRMRLAAVLQYCLPGVPCIYYGDEAGMEGYRDPFNRGCYPWDAPESALFGWFRKLGQLRRVAVPLREGRFIPVPAGPSVVCFERVSGPDRLLCAVNRAAEEAVVSLPDAWRGRCVNLGDGIILDGGLRLPAEGCAIALMGQEE